MLTQDIQECQDAKTWQDILGGIKIKVCAPCKEGPVDLYTDYSPTGGAGAILYQDERLVGMYSKAGTTTTQNYGAYKGEAWALKEGINKFRRYLNTGSRLHTDQKALTFLETGKSIQPSMYERFEDINRHGWQIRAVKGVNNE